MEAYADKYINDIPNDVKSSPFTHKMVLCVPTALEVLAPTEFLVFPLNRYPPPYFVERPFEHNFYYFVHGFVLYGCLDRIREGVNKEGRRYILAELSQHFENVTIVGRNERNITMMMKIYGFEGVTEDYVLFMHYPVLPGGANEEIEKDLMQMFSHVHTFNPVKLSHDESRNRVRQYMQTADSEYLAYIDEHGKEWFSTQFFITVARMIDLDLENSDDRKKIIDLLMPFQGYGNQVGINNDMWEELTDMTWDSFWQMFHEAENNENAQFFTVMHEMIEGLKSEIQGIQSTGNVL